MSSGTIAKVLLLTDDSSLLAKVRRVLPAREFDVGWAMSDADALESLDVQRPALIIVDGLTPRSSAIESCRALRQNSETRLIPLLLLSGDGSLHMRCAAAQAGVDEFAAPPIHWGLVQNRARLLVTEPHLPRGSASFRRLTPRYGTPATDDVR